MKCPKREHGNCPMDNVAIRFCVIGRPATQGSKKIVPITRGDGTPVIRNDRPLVRAVNDNPRLSDWRRQVAAAAREAYDGPLLTGAVSLSLSFVRPRPQSHFGTGRNVGVLKSSAPEHPTTKPDVLKLARAVEDSLSGTVVHDDSQVIRLQAEKRWGTYFQVEVTICRLD